MSLDRPGKGKIAREIESWRPFGDALRAEDRERYRRMMDRCCEYLPSMEVRAEPFPNEALFMGILFLQDGMIERLTRKVEALERKRK
jgi:hypothetical protein